MYIAHIYIYRYLRIDVHVSTCTACTYILCGLVLKPSTRQQSLEAGRIVADTLIVDPPMDPHSRIYFSVIPNI